MAGRTRDLRAGGGDRLTVPQQQIVPVAQERGLHLTREAFTCSPIHCGASTTKTGF
jgi:hypothetical protein